VHSLSAGSPLISSRNHNIIGEKQEEESHPTKNLKKLRTMAGRGQYWLAEQTGIERSRLSLIESLRVTATQQEKAAIEKALLGAMRENVRQFSRLSGIAVQSV
jgi:hypothetical protein